jgi:hypothetical protein
MRELSAMTMPSPSRETLMIAPWAADLGKIGTH